MKNMLILGLTLIINIMNKNINLVEILKHLPIGTKLYSPLAGELSLCGIYPDYTYSIKCKDECGNYICFTNDGRNYTLGECILFPSKEQRDWREFIADFATFYIGDTIVVDLNGTKRLAVYKGYNKANQKCKVLCLGWRRETYVNVEQIKKYKIEL